MFCALGLRGEIGFFHIAPMLNIRNVSNILAFFPKWESSPKLRRRSQIGNYSQNGKDSPTEKRLPIRDGKPILETDPILQKFIIT